MKSLIHDIPLWGMFWRLIFHKLWMFNLPYNNYITVLAVISLQSGYSDYS